MLGFILRQGSHRCIINSRGPQNGLCIRISSSENIEAFWGDGSYLLTGSSTISADQWHFVRLVRTNDSWSIYCDGVLEATTSIDASTSFDSSGVYMFIGLYGNYSASTERFVGYIDEVRFTVGHARDGSEVPTKAFPNTNVLRPLVTWSETNKASGVILSSDKLTADNGTASQGNARVCATQIIDSGKWYAEFTVPDGSSDGTTTGTDTYGVGIGHLGVNLDNFWVGRGNGELGLYPHPENNIYSGGTTYYDGPNNPDKPATIMIAVDFTDSSSLKAWAGVNGVWSANKSPNGSDVLIILTGTDLYFACTPGPGPQAITANFTGPFSYPIPDGFIPFGGNG